jgi:hypothetical protein
MPIFFRFSDEASCTVSTELTSQTMSSRSVSSPVKSCFFAKIYTVTSQITTNS